MNIKIAAVSILCVCLAGSCSEKGSSVDHRDREDDVSNIPMHYLSPSEEYRRDSLFVAATVWEFIRKEVSPYHYYNRFHISFNKIKVEVDTILYSPNSLKLFAWVITTYFDSKENRLISVGDGIIGYRSGGKKSIWKLYDFDQFATGGFRKYNSVRKLFREYYLNDGSFKTDRHYYWIKEKSRYEEIPFGYNLDDTSFWNNSIVWKKGIPIPGYYSFEVRDQAKPEDTNAVIRLPHLEYSDTILKLYNGK